jgi:hypothetical protein
MVCVKELKSGRAWLLSIGEQQCVLVREDDRLPQAEKLRLLSGSPGVAALLGRISLQGDSYIVVEYVGQRVNGTDEKDFADLLRVLAALNRTQILQYPVFGSGYYEASFDWCRKLMGFLRHRGAVAVPEDIVRQFDRVAGELMAYRATARRALIHGDPADFNCGRDATGQLKLFDFGLSGMDMWLKDIALRLGGSTSPRPAACSDRQWLAFYLGVEEREVPSGVWLELGLTRRICRLYYDEQSLRHFTDHPEDLVYREWAERIVQCVMRAQS